MEDQQQVWVLLVMPADDCPPFVKGLQTCSAELITALSCSEARRIINSGLSLNVIFSKLSLEDGSWWSIHQELARSNSPADLVVCSPRGKTAPKRLLEQGADGVLMTSYDEGHIHVALELAVSRYWERARNMGLGTKRNVSY